MSIEYELLKDLPNAKKGAIYRQTENGEDYVCFDAMNTWDVCYPKSYVEDNPEWFRKKNWYVVSEFKGEPHQIGVMLPDISVYGGRPNDLGVSIGVVEKLISEKDWRFDGEYFYHKDLGYDEIDASEFNVRSVDEWVYFSGIPMQYTGLKDKNGKEIYEGDIVVAETAELNEDFVETENFYDEDIQKVYWDDDAAGWFLTENRYKQVQPMAHRQRFEVIGNIYESPELIKSNNTKQST